MEDFLGGGVRWWGKSCLEEIIVQAEDLGVGKLNS